MPRSSRLRASSSSRGAGTRGAPAADEEPTAALSEGQGAIQSASSVAALRTGVSRLVRRLFQAAGRGAPVSAGAEALLNTVEASLERRFSELARACGSEAEEALRESEARFRAFAELGSDWYWEQDERLRFTRFEGRYPAANREAFASYIGHVVWELGLEAESGWEGLRGVMEARQPFRDFVHSRVLRDGSRRWFTASGDPIFVGGRFVGYRGVGRDITAQKAAEEQVRHRATHDSLTGLANRAMFSAMIERALQSAKRYKRRVAVLFVDLDGFKAVNDEIGHEGGDSLLREIASHFVHAVRTSDTVVRLGGDEFVVLVPELRERADLAPVARKILAAARMPVQVGGRECRVTASMGIAVFPEDGDSEQALMRRADQAMYAAKREGKNVFRFCA